MKAWIEDGKLKLVWGGGYRLELLPDPEKWSSVLPHTIQVGNVEVTVIAFPLLFPNDPRMKEINLKEERRRQPFVSVESEHTDLVGADSTEYYALVRDGCVAKFTSQEFYDWSGIVVPDI